MDFDIVEHNTGSPEPMAPIMPMMSTSGFPKTSKFASRRARWQKPEPEVKKPQLEAEKIHDENIAKISSMTKEEVDKERQDLLRELDPKLVKALLDRTEKRAKELEEKPETPWIGSVRGSDGNLTDLTMLDSVDVDKALGVKKVSFEPEVKTVNYEDLDKGIDLPEDGWEDVEDIHELVPNHIAPKDYQLVDDDEEDNNTVHFPKPEAVKLDLNDPDFYEKLHENYYPDLPKESEKLSWMTKPMPTQVGTSYDLISDMRFDFEGYLVPLDVSADVPTHKGLHHHLDNPHMAGYTLPELAHLARSVVPSQRSIAIKSLGRILFKLGKHQYQFMPTENDLDNPVQQEMASTFEQLVWQVINELRVVETLTEALNSPNLSVRNYALEALWLWREGGGQPETTDELVASIN